MLIRTFLTLSIACVSPISSAQPADFCLALAQGGFFDQFNERIVQGSSEQASSIACRTESSESGISGSSNSTIDFYDNLSGGHQQSSGSYAKAQSAACSKSSNGRQSTKDASVISSALSGNAVEMVRLCTDVKEPVNVEYYGAPDDDTFQLKLSLPPGLSTKFTKQTYESPTLKCRGDLHGVNTLFGSLRSEKLTLECDRGNYPTQTVSRLLHPGGHATVFTAAGSFTLFVPKKFKPLDCRPQPITTNAPTSPNNSVGFEALYSLSEGRGIEYSNAVTDTKASSDSGNEVQRHVEYKFTASDCGWYVIRSKYGSSGQRPMSLIVDGQTVKIDALAVDTKGFSPTSRKPFNEAAVFLAKGEHVLELIRNGPIPHIEEITLRPH